MTAPGTDWQLVPRPAIDVLVRRGNHAAMPPRRVVGCMTGTSMDALDVALVTVEGRGVELRAAVGPCLTRPLGALASALRRFAGGEPWPAREIARAANEFALLHVAAIRELSGAERPDLIVVHGQTVFHAPPLSWQLLAPAPIAVNLRAPVVYDLRAADLAAGGQGAPITPLADYVFFRSARETRAVLNLGGFCNFTLLGRGGLETIRGGDICVCNQLLDAVARQFLKRPYDEGGAHAGCGRVQPALRDELTERLRPQAAAGRSLGTGDELADWVRQQAGRVAGNDAARTVSEAIALTIGGAVHAAAEATGLGKVDRYLIAGGGVRNATLVGALRSHCAGSVELTDQHGVPAPYREAAAMAVLGALCADRVPITLPQVTRVASPAPLAGAWVYVD